MKNILCALRGHEVEFYPPKERKINPEKGKPYLYIDGMKCTKCGMILSHPRAPGKDEPLSEAEIHQLGRYNSDVYYGRLITDEHKKKMADYQRRFENLNMAGRVIL